jgi:hypothetical protein
VVVMRWWFLFFIWIFLHTCLQMQQRSQHYELCDYKAAVVASTLYLTWVSDCAVAPPRPIYWMLTRVLAEHLHQIVENSHDGLFGHGCSLGDDVGCGRCRAIDRGRW